MRPRHIVALLTLTFSAVASGAAPQAVFETSMGSITVELDTTHSPRTSNAFMAYARAGAYDNALFHRIAKKFVVQGGELRAVSPRTGEDPVRIEPDKKLPAFEPETYNHRSNLRGTLAAVREGASAQAPTGFFFNLSDNTFLDARRFDEGTEVLTPRGRKKIPAGTEIKGYAVFGTVIGGMEVLDRIQRVSVTRTYLYEHWPTTPIVLRRVRILTPAASK